MAVLHSTPRNMCVKFVYWIKHEIYTRVWTADSVRKERFFLQPPTKIKPLFAFSTLWLKQVGTKFMFQVVQQNKPLAYFSFLIWACSTHTHEYEVPKTHQLLVLHNCSVCTTTHIVVGSALHSTEKSENFTPFCEENNNYSWFLSKIDKRSFFLRWRSTAWIWHIYPKAW